MNVSLWNQPQTTIGHLTARYNGSRESIDRTPLRLRVERLLENADLRPPGLSSGAVLIVRRLDNPTAINVSSLALPVLADWQASLREQLAAVYAAAARPALGAVSLSAPGVLFADPGEMLTCLTRDLLNGQAHERWYWQQALRNLPRAPGAALPILWSAQAAALPGVFASLRPSEIYNAITCLTPRAIEQVIHSLHERFDLPTGTLVSGKREGDAFTQAIIERAKEGEDWTNTSPAGNPPPWEKWLPTAILPTLAPEARYLLGLGLALHHAPSFARSTRFAALSAAWLYSSHEKRPAAAEPERGAAMEPGLQPVVSPAQERTGEQITAILKEEEQGNTHGNEIDAESPEQQETIVSSQAESSLVARQNNSTLDDSSPAIETRASVFSPAQDTLFEEPGISSLQEILLPQIMEATAQQAAPMSSPQAALPALEATASLLSTTKTPTDTEERLFEMSASMALPADGVFTRLGGVLYLINLLTRLDLLHSWERDEFFVGNMSGWATIEALARCLLSWGSLHERFVDDPIWHILALLDGREPGMPIVISNMEPKEDRAFRLPAAWLHLGVPVSWSAVQRDERLAFFDDVTGFLVADVPLPGRSFFESAHAEVEAYREQGIGVNWALGSPGLARGLFSAEIGEGMSLPVAESLFVHLDEQVLWWLERVMGFVYHLLARALDVAPGEPERLAQLALCHAGQLIASRTHVDLHMSLEESSIALRRAGLDCDPGWVPDLGRIVYFHFD